MRKLNIPILLFLVGCSEGMTDSTLPNDDTIILGCSGEIIEGGSLEREKASYLIKVKDEGAHDSLLYYSDSEKRFEPSRCSRTTYDCIAVSTPDQITEQGTIRGSDNSVISSETTTINRRTGAMRTVQRINHLPDRVFEGTCVKAEPPAKVPQKF